MSRMNNTMKVMAALFALQVITSAIGLNTMNNAFGQTVSETTAETTGPRKVSGNMDDMVGPNVARQKVIDNGGSGRYKAVVVSDKTFKDYTIYRPRNVKWAARNEGGLLPILIWCNGACSDSSTGYERMLNEIASHGYLVVAIGSFEMTGDEREDGGSSETQVTTIIDWLQRQYKLASTDYFHAINLNNIAIAGHSCGGAQAIANCANTRVKTLLIMNAGMGGMSMGGASPQSLKSLHCPLIYMTGGPDDVAYNNAKGDYGSITKVPVVWADLPTAGHGGTYYNQGGGDFGRMAVKWMDWHLKGYDQNAGIFVKSGQTLFPNWKIQHKNFGTKDYEAPFRPLISVGDTVFDRAAAEKTFAFGADVSLLTKQESGRTFYNRKGAKKSVLAILKEQGMNSMRVSVLVNPSDGVCNPSYSRSLVSRAKSLGMNVMLDLHYSDITADGGSQYKPAAWKTNDFDALAENVYKHTYSMVNGINSIGIRLKWVQIGHELDNGLLWTDGLLQENIEGCVKLLNRATEAVKTVNPDIQTVIHVAQGQDTEWLTTYFDALRDAGAKWDVIGLSAFPKVAKMQPDELIAKTVENVKMLQERYGTPVMIVETGYYNSKQLESNHFLCDFMKELIDAGGAGLFYMEPEMTDDCDQGAWNIIDRKPSIALDAFLGLRHSEVPYLMTVAWDLKDDTMLDGDNTITVPVDVQHIRERDERVELMSGLNVLGSSTERPYNVEWTEPVRGLNKVHAIATSSDDLTVSTDTVNVIVGPALKLSAGETVTGDDETQPEQYWDITFLQPGNYQLVFKYATDKRQSCNIYVDGEKGAFLSFSATEGKAGYQKVGHQAAEAGTYRISLKPYTTSEMPEVETLWVVPLEGQPLPLPGEYTGIQSVDADETGTIVYDLSGRIVDFSKTPKKGVYIIKSAGQTRKVYFY